MKHVARNKIMHNLKDGDLMQTLTDLDTELNNAWSGFKCGFLCGFVIGAVVSGVITWAVMA